MIAVRLQLLLAFLLMSFRCDCCSDFVNFVVCGGSGGVEVAVAVL